MNEEESSCWDDCFSNNKCEHFLLRVCCCCCWEKLSERNKHEYPHIQYEVLPTDRDSKEPFEDTHAPIEKIFKYPQKYREFSIHPQLEAEDDDSQLLIVEQPRSTIQLKEFEASLSDQSFSLGTAVHDSELPGDYSSEEESDLSYGGSMEDIDADVGFVVDSYLSRQHVATDSDDVMKTKRRRAETFKKCYHPKKMDSLRLSGSMPKSLSVVRRVSDNTMEQRLKEIGFKPKPITSGVQFSLFYDKLKSVLIVRVHHILQIPTSRPAETSNPFVQVYLLPMKIDIQQSHIVERTHNPMFDSIFNFGKLSIEDLRRQMMIIRIYINDLNHFVGGVIYSLDNADLHGESAVVEISKFDEEECLKDSFQGDLLITVNFLSKTDVLEVLVLEANNLKKQDFLGMPNPYVKINVIHRGQRVSKWKTNIKNGTLSPVFNELCEIDVSTMNIEEVEVEVILMDYDRFGHNNEVGTVSFGDNVLHKSGQSHWKRVMIENNVDISQWHAIVPSSSSQSTRKPRARSEALTPVRGCMSMTPSGLQI